MDSVLDIVQKEEQEVSQGQETKCEFCEESSATTFCLECPQYFCDDCGRKVHKLESLKDHHVLSVENYESEKGKGSQNYKRPDYCKTHQKQELRFYCDKCKIPICVECTVIDHPSPKHSCRCLMEVSAECCKKLTKMIAILRDKAQERRKCGFAHYNGGSLGRPVVPRRPVTVKLRRPDGAKRTLDVVDNGDCTHTVTVCGKHAGVYQVIVLVDYQEIPGSPFDILVIKGLVKLLGMKGNDVGEFNGPAGLTLTNDGDVAVVDPKNTRIQILDVDGNWKKMFEYDDIQVEFQPTDIAVSKDGRYFVTDAKNTQVVVSDENGQWLSCFGETELKYPRGIAISPLDGAVFVTDWDGKVLATQARRNTA
ncbi:E3 ubiquitin-protein ligase TRIM71-like [Ptychodera flava]|uniref:E3 ubiquitin-protein ligase TRIM71-like n=1 Tax=Ptychodera flava TaxID=63121 RepID=UPI00396A603B